MPAGTQIAPLEALAVLRATVLFAEELRGRDVLLFIDNQAVCAAYIKGASAAVDLAQIVSAAHLLWAALRRKVWIEWIPLLDNPSDGASRAGAAKLAFASTALFAMAPLFHTKLGTATS